MINNQEVLFNAHGWRIPSENYETFSNSPKWFFKLGDSIANHSSILNRLDKFSPIHKKDHLNIGFLKLENELKSNNAIKNLDKGVRIPFVINKISVEDIGQFLEKNLFNLISKSFNDIYPESHFKAVIQDKTFLTGKLSPSPNTGYSTFLEKLSQSDICGYYYPQALQEYSVTSQINQMKDLKNITNLCLSGPIEVAYSLIGAPNLLINKTHYSPVLCLSGASHIDERLICCFKSYGPHLEFWCLSQMLTFGKKQCSEQWSGGFTFYTDY